MLEIIRFPPELKMFTVLLVMTLAVSKSTHLGKLRQNHFFTRKVNCARERVMLGLVSNQGTDKLSLLLLNLQEKLESQSLWSAQLIKGLLSFLSLVPGSPVQ